MSATRPTRRVSGSTVRAVERLALDPATLARVLSRRVGWARRWDPHQRPVPRRQGAALASGSGVGA